MKLYGLIGYPLGHSFSKDFFNKKFSTESIADSNFELFPLQDINQLKPFVHSVKGLTGLSVTFPHKEAIIPYLDELDGISGEIGAVNCVRVNENKLYGFNTDVIGFEKSFMPLRESHHHKALILGTGGASKAVKYVLSKHGIPFLQVSRNPGAIKFFITYEMLDDSIMSEYNIIINCTPAGMYPAIADKPNIPYGCITSRHLLYDLIYNPSDTLFLKEGKKAGAVTKNGYEMLVLQAEESWKIWNGKSI